MLKAWTKDLVIILLPHYSAAYGLIERPNDFASYLLAIAICNLLLYFAFYIIMKVGVCSLTLCVHAISLHLKLCCLFSCAVVRGSSVCRWCVFSSRLLCGALHSISSSRVSAPGRSVSHTHTRLSTNEGRTCVSFSCYFCGFRKHPLSLVNTTETASCFPSLTTMMSGTFSPPSPCLDPSWYAQDSQIRY